MSLSDRHESLTPKRPVFLQCNIQIVDKELHSPASCMHDAISRGTLRVMHCRAITLPSPATVHLQAIYVACATNRVIPSTPITSPLHARRVLITSGWPATWLVTAAVHACRLNPGATGLAAY
jgi:hypothetical protein